ncbi:hypothetical protein BH18THE2_BH18THE2_33370 [soil metagenome]
MDLPSGDWAIISIDGVYSSFDPSFVEADIVHRSSIKCL